ncbi:hypothetical protein Tco_1335610 [Tanacetum coccineum]
MVGSGSCYTSLEEEEGLGGGTKGPAKVIPLRVILEITARRRWEPNRRIARLTPRDDGQSEEQDKRGKTCIALEGRKFALGNIMLELPDKLRGIHNTFHVSNLKKCLADENLVIPLEEIQLDDKLHFIEEPVEIMDPQVEAAQAKSNS